MSKVPTRPRLSRADMMIGTGPLQRLYRQCWRSPAENALHDVDGRRVSISACSCGSSGHPIKSGAIATWHASIHVHRGKVGAQAAVPEASQNAGSSHRLQAQGVLGQAQSMALSFTSLKSNLDDSACASPT